MNSPGKKKRMKADECLICGAPLEYLDHPVEMECSICHRHFLNTVRCRSGHYVCDECHTGGMDGIWRICLEEKSDNPVLLMERMMSLGTCHMHGPEHHIMVGAALITAYRNAGGNIDLQWGLSEIIRRGKQVPGGACGNWGACGAGISAGQFVSTVSRCNPLASESWGLSNLMTSEALAAIARHGGPRCCKRDSYEAILSAVRFADEHLGVRMNIPDRIVCSRSSKNNQCLGRECPFSITETKQDKL